MPSDRNNQLDLEKMKIAERLGAYIAQAGLNAIANCIANQQG